MKCQIINHACSSLNKSTERRPLYRIISLHAIPSSLQTTEGDCSLQYYRSPQAGLGMPRKLRSTFYRSDRYSWTPLIRTRLFEFPVISHSKPLTVIISALQPFSVSYSLIFKMTLTMTLLVLISAFPTLAPPTGHTHEEMDLEKLIKEIRTKPCAHS